MRVEETTFYERNQIVEVRSRPLWVVILEFWFLWVHEFWSHTLPIRPKLPTGNVDYWGDDGFEAAFHHFYTWTLNHDLTIDKSAQYTNLYETRRKPV